MFRVPPSESEQTYDIAFNEGALNKLKRKKKYTMVVLAPDFPDSESRENSRQLAYLVPRKFPFIFQVCADQLENDIDPVLLHAAFQKLNSLKRLLVSKSFIPKKIIYANMEKLCQGREARTGCLLSLSVFEPLTGAVKFSRSALPFELFEVQNQKVAVVDLEVCEEGQPHALLDSRCNVLEVGVNIGKYARKQRFVVFLLNSWKVKSTELYYCLLKLNSQMLLKIYFEPNELELTQPTDGGEGVCQIRSFRLTRVQVEIGKAAEGLSGLSKGSFLTSINRAKVNCDEANYRMNLLVPHKNQQLLVCDPTTINALSSCTPNKREHVSFFRDSLRFFPDVFVQRNTDQSLTSKQLSFKKKVNTDFGDSKSQYPQNRLPIFQGMQKSEIALKDQIKECLSSEDKHAAATTELWLSSANTDHRCIANSVIRSHQPSDFVQLNSASSSAAERKATDPRQHYKRHTAAIVRNPHLPREQISSRQYGLLPHQQSLVHVQQPSSNFSASRSDEIEALESLEQNKRKHSLRALGVNDASVKQYPSPQRYYDRTHDERVGLSKKTK